MDFLYLTVYIGTETQENQENGIQGPAGDTCSYIYVRSYDLKLKPKEFLSIVFYKKGSLYKIYDCFLAINKALIK